MKAARGHETGRGHAMESAKPMVIENTRLAFVGPATGMQTEKIFQKLRHRVWRRTLDRTPAAALQARANISQVCTLTFRKALEQLTELAGKGQNRRVVMG